jgi:hypothetical protein
LYSTFIKSSSLERSIEGLVTFLYHRGTPQTIPHPTPTPQTAKKRLFENEANAPVSPPKRQHQQPESPLATRGTAPNPKEARARRQSVAPPKSAKVVHTDDVGVKHLYRKEVEPVEQDENQEDLVGDNDDEADRTLDVEAYSSNFSISVAKMMRVSHTRTAMITLTARVMGASRATPPAPLHTRKATTKTQWSCLLSLASRSKCAPADLHTSTKCARSKSASAAVSCTPLAALLLPTTETRTPLRERLCLLFPWMRGERVYLAWCGGWTKPWLMRESCTSRTAGTRSHPTRPHRIMPLHWETRRYFRAWSYDSNPPEEVVYNAHKITRLENNI